MSFIVDVRNVCDKPCCYDILVLKELITSVSSFGKNVHFVGKNEMLPWFEK